MLQIAGVQPPVLVERAAPARLFRPLDASVPEFAYATRDASLYEPAENCGECHVDDYRDWKRSTHARTNKWDAEREPRETIAHNGGFWRWLLYAREADAPIVAEYLGDRFTLEPAWTHLGRWDAAIRQRPSAAA